MNGHWEQLNAWHLQLSIVADAIEHLLLDLEEPEGLSATAHVVKLRLRDLVESCPFPESPKRMMPFVDADLIDFDGDLPVDVDGVPGELLAGAFHD
jgi:hypothetical protein